MSILNRDFKILDKTLLFIDNLDNLISNVRYKVEEFTNMKVNKINVIVEGVRITE